MKNNWKHNKKIRKSITRFRRITEILAKQNLSFCCNHKGCYVIRGSYPNTKVIGNMEDYKKIIKQERSNASLI